MRVSEFLREIGTLPTDWDEELYCAACGAPILELHSLGAVRQPLDVELVRWANDRPARNDDEIVCPRCGCRSPVGRPHLRDPL